MLRDIDVPGVARKIAEAFAIGHLVTINILFLLGETTNLFSFVQGPYLSVAARHAGVLFAMENIDLPIYQLVQNTMLSTSNTVIFFMWGEVVALVCSALYATLCWFFARMFLGIFRVQ